MPASLDVGTWLTVSVKTELYYKSHKSTPSIATLRDGLGIPDEDARTLKMALTGRLDLLTTDAGQRRYSECYHAPSALDVMLHVANDIIGGYGVEYVAHVDDETWNGVSGFEYIKGETYGTTLTYCYKSGRWRVTSCGDLVEAHEGWYV